uniref:Protein ARV n=1 Tax=Plectus sambesii TaxID=2011161 RepID=A0A914XN17_9BILA
MTDDAKEVVCINCGRAAPHLYQQYCSTVLKLTECTHCGKVVDKYVEYDVVLVVLDLILQDLCAYRHILLNAKLKNYWRLATLFVLCDAYYKWIERRSADFPNDSLLIYDLEWRFYQCLLQSVVETAVFVVAILILHLVLTSQPDRLNTRQIVNSVIAGFYGNVLVVLAIVWQLHQTWSYVVLTQIFIFISQVQVQRAVSALFTSVGRAVAAVIIATGFKRVTGMIISAFF